MRGFVAHDATFARWLIVRVSPFLRYSQYVLNADYLHGTCMSLRLSTFQLASNPTCYPEEFIATLPVKFRLRQTHGLHEYGYAGPSDGQAAW